jgi:hypothetical protein
MTDFRLSGVRQTPWACGPGGEIWYACVHADIDDEVVIETAKRLVDRAIPQKQPTFFGGQSAILEDVLNGDGFRFH